MSQQVIPDHVELLTARLTYLFSKWSAVLIWQLHHLASKCNAVISDLAVWLLPSGFLMTARYLSESSILGAFAVDTPIHKPANDPGQYVFDGW